MPPTGKSTSSDYVYVMEFQDGKISHMTKIWNAGWAMKEPAGSNNSPLEYLSRGDEYLRTEYQASRTGRLACVRGRAG